MNSAHEIFYSNLQLLRKKTMEEYFKPTEAEHSVDKDNVFLELVY